MLPPPLILRKLPGSFRVALPLGHLRISPYPFSFVPCLGRLHHALCSFSSTDDHFRFILLSDTAKIDAFLLAELNTLTLLPFLLLSPLESRSFSILPFLYRASSERASTLFYFRCSILSKEAASFRLVFLVAGLSKMKWIPLCRTAFFLILFILPLVVFQVPKASRCST